MISRIKKRVGSLEEIINCSIAVAFIVIYILEILFGVEGAQEIVFKYVLSILVLIFLGWMFYDMIFRPFTIVNSHFPQFPMIGLDHNRGYYINRPILPSIQENGTKREYAGFLVYSIRIDDKWYTKVKMIRVRTKTWEFLGSGKTRVNTIRLPFPPEMKYQVSEEEYHEYSHSRLPNSQWDFCFRHEIEKESLELASGRFFFEFKIGISIEYVWFWIWNRTLETIETINIEINP